MQNCVGKLEKFNRHYKRLKKCDEGGCVVVKSVDVSVEAGKGLVPEFRVSCMTLEVLPINEYLLKVILGFQQTLQNILFSYIYDSSKLRPWLSSDHNSEVNLD